MIRVSLKPAAVGLWTLPYRRPRGTKAAQIIRLEGTVAFLSDGSDMHVSYVRVCEPSTVAS